MKKIIFSALLICPLMFSCSSEGDKKEEESQVDTESEKSDEDKVETIDAKPLIELDFRDLNVEEFAQFVSDPDAVVLDVRTADEWSANGIIDSSALMIDWYDESFASKVEADIPKSKSVYVYCHGGGRSSEAADSLLNMGYNNVYNLEEGFMSWKKAEKTIVKISED